MKERGLIFNAQMVRAILAWKKTQTRRKVKYRFLMPSENGYPDDFTSDRCPYGIPGDRLWVREAWTPSDGHVSPEVTPQYRANLPEDECSGIKWKSPIFMPRWASRITLELTGVRVERLQDISEEDARSEGVGAACMTTAREEFRILWQSINDAGTWEANPFVWVLEFRRLIDAG